MRRLAGSPLKANYFPPRELTVRVGLVYNAPTLTAGGRSGWFGNSSPNLNAAVVKQRKFRAMIHGTAKADRMDPLGVRSARWMRVSAMDIGVWGFHTYAAAG